MIGLITGMLLGFSIGFLSGYTYRDINDIAHKLYERQKSQPEPEPEAYVTRGDRRFVKEHLINQPESAVVTPKTPQRIAWEEEEELRKMNLGSK